MKKSDLEIERPRFYHKLINGVDTKEDVITKVDFHLWWTEQVEPLNKILREGTLVISSGNQLWKPHNGEFLVHGFQIGLLINAKPVVRESPEDVLRDWIKHQDQYDHNPGPLADFIRRGKRALEVSE